jgi:hypothetical protein
MPDPGRGPADHPAGPRARPGHRGAGPVSRLPPPGDAARLASVLAEQPGWSAFWDKREGIWRVAEDDPGSDLYAASSDAGTVIAYIHAHA